MHYQPIVDQLLKVCHTDKKKLIERQKGAESEAESVFTAGHFQPSAWKMDSGNKTRTRIEENASFLLILVPSCTSWNLFQPP